MLTVLILLICAGGLGIFVVAAAVVGYVIGFQDHLVADGAADDPDFRELVVEQVQLSGASEDEARQWADAFSVDREEKVGLN